MCSGCSGPSHSNSQLSQIAFKNEENGQLDDNNKSVIVVISTKYSFSAHITHFFNQLELKEKYVKVFGEVSTLSLKFLKTRVSSEIFTSLEHLHRLSEICEDFLHGTSLLSDVARYSIQKSVWEKTEQVGKKNNQHLKINYLYSIGRIILSVSHFLDSMNMLKDYRVIRSIPLSLVYISGYQCIFNITGYAFLFFSAFNDPDKFRKLFISSSGICLEVLHHSDSSRFTKYNSLIISVFQIFHSTQLITLYSKSPTIRVLTSDLKKAIQAVEFELPELVSP